MSYYKFICHDDGNLDTVAIGSWKVTDSDKDFLRKGFDPIGFPGLMNVVLVSCNGGEGDEKYSGGEDIDNGYQEFEVENSESPLREERLIHSLEDLGMDGHGNMRERERERY
jgi:hypothetical protein